MPVRREIERLARLPAGPSAPEIRRQLELEDRYADSVPSLSRIQQIAKAAAIVDDTDPLWTVRDGSGAAAALVLPVLAGVIRETRGKRRHVSRREAAWIVRVRRARPDLLPWWVYQFTRAYVAAEIQKDAVALRRLDEQLAVAPIQPPSDFAATRALSQSDYQRGLRDGWIDSATFMIWPETWRWIEEQGRHREEQSRRPPK